MATEPFLVITLAAIIATLGAIVYVLRYIVIMERRVERIEGHIETIVTKVLNEEIRIERSLGSRKKRK